MLASLLWSLVPIRWSIKEEVGQRATEVGQVEEGECPWQRTEKSDGSQCANSISTHPRSLPQRLWPRRQEWKLQSFLPRPGECSHPWSCSSYQRAALTSQSSPGWDFQASLSQQEMQSTWQQEKGAPRGKLIQSVSVQSGYVTHCHSYSHLSSQFAL